MNKFEIAMMLQVKFSEEWGRHLKCTMGRLLASAGCTPGRGKGVALVFAQSS